MLCFSPYSFCIYTKFENFRVKFSKSLYRTLSSNLIELYFIHFIKFTINNDISFYKISLLVVIIFNGGSTSYNLQDYATM